VLGRSNVAALERPVLRSGMSIAECGREFLVEKAHATKHDGCFLVHVGDGRWPL
jgi:hypothetical protein